MMAPNHAPQFELASRLTESTRGHLFRLLEGNFRSPRGNSIRLEYAQRPPGVRVIATDGARVLISREWRSELNRWDLRLPGGKLFDTLDDYTLALDDPSYDWEGSVRGAAQKELREEVALELATTAFSVYHQSICGATVLWDLYYLVAIVNSASDNNFALITDEGERIESHWLSYSDAAALCVSGAFGEDRTVGVLLRFLLMDHYTPSPEAAAFWRHDES